MSRLEFHLLSSFADLGVPDDVAALLTRQGIAQPFPIQAATLPDALAGKDVCGRAPTGSGKTLAFAIAAIDAVSRGPKAVARRPRGLVLVPTRELAAQVCAVIDPLAALRKLSVASVYGGTGYGPQLRALRSGVDLLVACPGRLEDLVERGDVSLADVGLVVVDEADRMADMGFLPAVKRILDATSNDRQVLLFSATLDGEVDVLIRRYQRTPSRHEVEAPAEQAGDVEHLFWKVDRNDRVALATKVVAGHESAVVFCRTRHGADRLAKQLSAAGVEAVALHGSRTQAQRDRALADFHRKRARALVATDVAARGIHVESVACVVHFDPPGDSKDYVHRSGRTGRAGATGTVVSLVTPDQVKDVRSIQRALGFPQALDHPAPPRAVDVPRPAPEATPPAKARKSPARRDATISARNDRNDRNGDPRRNSRPGSGPVRSAREARPSRPATFDRPVGDGARQKRDQRTVEGTVKWYDPVRGFGFIAQEGGGRDVFVHRTALGNGIDRLSEGDRVEFLSRPGPKGLEALELRAC